MLRTFADKLTENIWQRKHVKQVHPKIARTTLRKLAILDAAVTLDDANSPPGNQLEQLKGNRAGQHSIRVNDQYRICFTWTPAGPEDVELTNHYD